MILKLVLIGVTYLFFVWFLWRETPLP
jgi:hypothetical protein